MTGCSAISGPLDAPRRDRLQRALASLELARLGSRPWALTEAYREAARAYRDTGELPSATTLMALALRWSALLGAADARADLLCEWAELLAEESVLLEHQERGSGRPQREQARDAIFEAAQVAARVADPRWEVTVLLRLSDVLDRFGDRDDATVLQMRALQLTVGHRPEARSPCVQDAQMAHPH
jgi:hypothetical protein